MSHFRYLTAGESHGKCLTAIIEGLPSGLFIDIDFINEELSKRQQGYGRSERMQIETDKVEITSGIYNNKTTGAPLCLIIYNKDFSQKPSFSKFRPGHADYSGSIKYNLDDLRPVLERASARKTAIDVAVGAIAKLLLKEFNIYASSKILQIGKVTENFEQEIDKIKANNDSTGGKFEIKYTNLPIGLGSYVHFDRTLDGKIAQEVMSISAIKVVEIGENPLGKYGSEYHDEIFYENGKITRHSNNAGGIEGGMTNGEDLIVRAVMKPIPTLTKPLKTIDMKSFEATEAHSERADVCAVEACCIVAENKIACVLANEFLQKFGGDSIEEITRNYKNL